MYILLYLVAVMSVIVGCVWAYNTGNIVPISNGALSAVLFGSLGKIVHLLSQIEGHLAKQNNPQSENTPDLK